LSSSSSLGCYHHHLCGMDYLNNNRGWRGDNGIFEVFNFRIVFLSGALLVAGIFFSLVFNIRNSTMSSSSQPSSLLCMAPWDHHTPPLSFTILSSMIITIWTINIIIHHHMSDVQLFTYNAPYGVSAEITKESLALNAILYLYDVSIVNNSLSVSTLISTTFSIESSAFFAALLMSMYFKYRVIPRSRMVDLLLVLKLKALETA